ncbi:DUF4097 family beta strand repeat-containing protein [Halorarius halobius]|uniref:DUF4097 family beta strand repeat-containing protein n=1 Tax=Halorarius halobius TaxID=2962671 RepID=UPI0020CB87B0|nr:DUF4097 family beta strand repeat-containing protein [Halorarius halobius]
MSPTPDPADASDDDRTLSRRRLLGAAAAVGATGLAGCTGTFVRIESAETTVERRFDAADLARLRVAEADDDVSVERTDGDAVVVRAHKRARGETDPSEFGLRADVDGDTLRVGTRKPTVVGVGGDSIDLELEVPESVAVDRVHTDDGSVALRSVGGDPTVESGDGDLAVYGATGAITATTDDGEVAIEGTAGPVTARSDDGDVVVHDPGSVREVRSHDGEVVASVPAVDGSAVVASDDGDVTVTLGDALDAAVEVTTDDGRVTVAGGLDDVEAAAESRVTGTVGDGTNDLRIHSGDGDVTVTSL